MKTIKCLLAIAFIFLSVTMIGVFSYAEDDVARDSSTFDGGSGSTINTSTQTPVEANSSSVPDIGPSGPVEQQ